jgi:predicted aspartyl protease
MGKVTVRAKVENYFDVLSALNGKLPSSEIRSVDIADALVDTGATMLSLPARVIERLGLVPTGKRRLRTTTGIREAKVYTSVQLTIQGRRCNLEVIEVPNDCPALIGQLPLEALDFLVDPLGQKLIGNPEHHGEHMADEF